MFQRLRRWLRPRAGGYFGLLLQQAELLEQAARRLANVTDKTQPPQAALDALSQHDRRGEELLRSVLGELGRAYLTPFGREDLHELSSTLHGVLFSLCRAGQVLVAYEIEILSPATRRLIQICIEATHALHIAVQACGGRQTERLFAQRLHLKALDRSAEATYHAERVALYKSPQISAKQAMRQQAMLDALRAAIGKCQLAGNVLERLLVKHS